MDSGEITTVTSELTIAEVLVKPKQDQNQALEGAYRRFLDPTPLLRLAAVTREILEEAATIRAASKIQAPGRDPSRDSGQLSL